MKKRITTEQVKIMLQDSITYGVKTPEGQWEFVASYINRFFAEQIEPKKQEFVLLSAIGKAQFNTYLKDYLHIGFMPYGNITTLNVINLNPQHKPTEPEVIFTLLMVKASPDYNHPDSKF